MKKQSVVALCILLLTSYTFTLFAQENAREKVKTKSNIKNDRISVVQINATDEGCSIVFGTEVITTAAAVSGLPTGKRVYKPLVITKEFMVSAANNEVLWVKNPKAASGMATVSRTAGTPIGGIIVKGGKNPGGLQLNSIKVENGEFTFPADLPNGEYTMTLSWSWGEAHPGSNKKFEKTFNLIMEDGVCKGINQAGIPLQ